MACVALLCTLLLTLCCEYLVPSAAQVVSEDPCDKRLCMWGEMCRSDEAGYTYCECPWTCPDVYEPVCTVYGIQFQSKCHLHMFACTEGVNIGIKNKGPCENKTEASDSIPDPRSYVCPNKDQMVDFRSRYLEWMFIHKERSKLEAGQTYNLTRRIQDLSIKEKTEIAQWHFSQHDADKNDALEGVELDGVIQLMMYEPCGVGLISSCDLDKKRGIIRSEWNMCFNLAEREPFKRRKILK